MNWKIFHDVIRPPNIKTGIGPTGPRKGGKRTDRDLFSIFALVFHKGHDRLTDIAKVHIRPDDIPHTLLHDRRCVLPAFLSGGLRGRQLLLCAERLHHILQLPAQVAGRRHQQARILGGPRGPRVSPALAHPAHGRALRPPCRSGRGGLAPPLPRLAHPHQRLRAPAGLLLRVQQPGVEPVLRATVLPLFSAARAAGRQRPAPAADALRGERAARGGHALHAGGICQGVLVREPHCALPGLHGRHVAFPPVRTAETQVPLCAPGHPDGSGLRGPVSGLLSMCAAGAAGVPLFLLLLVARGGGARRLLAAAGRAVEGAVVPPPDIGRGNQLQLLPAPLPRVAGLHGLAGRRRLPAGVVHLRAAPLLLHRAPEPALLPLLRAADEQAPQTVAEPIGEGPLRRPATLTYLTFDNF